MPAPVRVTFVDPSDAVVAALREAVADAAVSSVDVRAGSVFDVAADGVVTPTNSFGFMDGGLDAVCVARFGPDVERRVRQAIRDRHHGELLVGQAVVVPTGDREHPWLVAAPTMRLPRRLPRGTVNPFLAMRAALLTAAAAAPRPLRSLVVPGLGTGTGGVPPRRAARQMVAAVQLVRDGGGAPASWLDAVDRQRVLIDG